jgi:hypothetical protein
MHVAEKPRALSIVSDVLSQRLRKLYNSLLGDNRTRHNSMSPVFDVVYLDRKVRSKGAWHPNFRDKTLDMIARSNSI